MRCLLGIGLLQILAAPVVFAQTGDIPSCAVSCYQSAVVYTGCATNDILCQCGPASETTTVQNILTTCLAAACSSTDILLYQVWATSECAVASATATLKTATATPKPRTTTIAGSAATVTSSSYTSSSSSAPKKSYLGIIIGSVVGGLILIGLICMAVIFCLWRKSKNRDRQRADDAAGKPMMAHHNQQPPQTPGNLQAPSHLPYQVPLVGEQKIEDPRIGSAIVSPVSPMEKFQGGQGGNEQMRPQTVEMQGEGRRNDFVEMGPGEVRKPVGGVGQEPAEMGPGGRG